VALQFLVDKNTILIHGIQNVQCSTIKNSISGFSRQWQLIVFLKKNLCLHFAFLYWIFQLFSFFFRSKCFCLRNSIRSSAVVPCSMLVSLILFQLVYSAQGLLRKSPKTSSERCHLENQIETLSYLKCRRTKLIFFPQIPSTIDYWCFPDFLSCTLFEHVLSFRFRYFSVTCGRLNCFLSGFEHTLIYLIVAYPMVNRHAANDEPHYKLDDHVDSSKSWPLIIPGLYCWPERTCWARISPSPRRTSRVWSCGRWRRRTSGRRRTDSRLESRCLQAEWRCAWRRLSSVFSRWATPAASQTSRTPCCWPTFADPRRPVTYTVYFRYGNRNWRYPQDTVLQAGRRTTHWNFCNRFVVTFPKSIWPDVKTTYLLCGPPPYRRGPHIASHSVCLSVRPSR